MTDLHARSGGSSSDRVVRVAIRMGEAASSVPGLKQLLPMAYTHYFNSLNHGTVRCFNGVYVDFSDAIKQIPANHLEGYDNASSAYRAADARFRVMPCDYPILFWLSYLLPDCKLLFDWGGNVGMSYFAYQKYLTYPEAMTWLVCDVPAVVKLGEGIAAAQYATQIQFTTELTRFEDADIVIAAGSMQFIEHPFHPFQDVRSLPRNILVNKIPVYEWPDAVTLQNMGTALCPYHLFNRKDFISQFQHRGYRLVDHWMVPELGCQIPFHREHSIREYSGFYFELMSH